MRSGESALLPPLCPGFDSRTWCHMWSEFVVGSRPCSESFSPGSPVFLPSTKTGNTPNSNSTWNQWTKNHLVDVPLLNQGRSQDFSKGGGGGSHWVKQYRHGVFATEYCRLFT